jgi:hypothetical protein
MDTGHILAARHLLDDITEQKEMLSLMPHGDTAREWLTLGDEPITQDIALIKAENCPPARLRAALRGKDCVAVTISVFQSTVKQREVLSIINALFAVAKDAAAKGDKDGNGGAI